MALRYVADGLSDIRQWVATRLNSARSESHDADRRPYLRYNMGYKAGRVAALQEVREFLDSVDLAPKS